MKLAKALKVKNRLTGEIARLQQLVRRENVLTIRVVGERTISRDRRIDVNETMLEIEKKIDELLALKTAIAKANVGNYLRIAQMAEAKAIISFYESLDFAGDEHITTDTNGKVSSVTRYEDAISRKTADEAVRGNQLAIERLQDEIDEYNATTEVVI